MADSSTAAATSEEPVAKTVIYCAVCTLPPEYCEFGGSVKKCKEWLEEEHPELHQRLYSSEAIAEKMASMSVEANEKAEKDLAKKQQKEEAKAERDAAKKKSSTVILKRVERTKRKHVIVVSGLETFGLDLKKIAKEWGKKFACGSSVTKSAAGTEEITVQGDVSDEIMDDLTEKHGIDEDNIKQIEEKKKKGGGD